MSEDREGIPGSEEKAKDQQEHGVSDTCKLVSREDIAEAGGHGVKSEWQQRPGSMCSTWDTRVACWEELKEGDFSRVFQMNTHDMCEVLV